MQFTIHAQLNCILAVVTLNSHAINALLFWIYLFQTIIGMPSEDSSVEQIVCVSSESLGL